MDEKKVVVDGEFQTIEKPPTIGIRTEFTVGMDETGSLYYRIAGPDRGLVALEGLLKYAHVELDRMWARSVERRNEETGA